MAYCVVVCPRTAAAAERIIVDDAEKPADDVVSSQLFIFNVTFNLFT